MSQPPWNFLNFELYAIIEENLVSPFMKLRFLRLLTIDIVSSSEDSCESTKRNKICISRNPPSVPVPPTCERQESNTSLSHRIGPQNYFIQKLTRNTNKINKRDKRFKKRLDEVSISSSSTNSHDGSPNKNRKGLKDAANSVIIAS